MKDCVSCMHLYLSPMSDTCRECGIAMLNYEERKPTTHADRIRGKSDEELADLLTAVAKKSAEMLRKSLKTVEVDLSECDFEILTKTFLPWLKSPVEEGER